MKKRGILILGLMAVAGILLLLLPPFRDPLLNSVGIKKSPSIINNDAPKGETENSTFATTILSAEPALEWHQSFNHIAQKMSGLSDNPDQTDQEITSFAQTLLTSQLNELYSLVVTKNTPGDEKLLAAELLARSQLPISVDLLKKLAMKIPEDVSQVPMVQQEFRAFQMLAIEGLTQKPELQSESKKALSELATSTSDTLLLDRIHRSLWALQGKAPPPEQQDQEALKKVLER